MTIKMGSAEQAEPQSADSEPGHTPDEPAAEQASEERQATPDERRAAILRMVAEGRITPEEGDLLLEALG
nr:MAG: hypothetical protein DIU80_01445 [Chloroflexota bacterium]